MSLFMLFSTSCHPSSQFSKYFHSAGPIFLALWFNVSCRLGLAGQENKKLWLAITRAEVQTHVGSYRPNNVTHSLKYNGSKPDLPALQVLMLGHTQQFLNYGDPPREVVVIVLA